MIMRWVQYKQIKLLIFGSEVFTLTSLFDGTEVSVSKKNVEHSLSLKVSHCMGLWD